MDSANAITNTALLGAYDGKTDFGGISGEVFSQAPVTNNVTTIDMSHDALFTGTGGLTLGLDALGSFSVDAGANAEAQSRGQAGAIVSVSFTYIPDPGGLTSSIDVPEPASAGILAFGLMSLGIAQRRRCPVRRSATGLD